MSPISTVERLRNDLSAVTGESGKMAVRLGQGHNQVGRAESPSPKTRGRPLIVRVPSHKSLVGVSRNGIGLGTSRGPSRSSREIVSSILTANPIWSVGYLKWS